MSRPAALSAFRKNQKCDEFAEVIPSGTGGSNGTNGFENGAGR
jgi:hypothetical protein